MKIPYEVLARLQDCGLEETEANIKMAAREILDLMAEGGSTFDEDTPRYRNAIKRNCKKILNT